MRDDLSLLVTHTDGRTTRWGPDELDAGDIPSDLTFDTSDPGGDTVLATELLRRIDVVQHDEAAFDNVEVIDKAGETIWEGRMAAFPREHGDSFSVRPQAEGWVAHLRDHTAAQEVYVDTAMDSWADLPYLNEKVRIAAASQSAAELSFARDDGWTCALPNQALPTGSQAELWYAMPGTVNIAKVAYQGKENLPSFVGLNSRAFEMAAGDQYDGSQSLAVTNDDTLRYLTPTTPRRYVAAFVYVGTGGTPAVAHYITYKQLVVYGDHGVTLRDNGTEAQGVFASDVVEHAVAKYAPLLNFTPGESVEPTSVVIPHLVFPELTTAEAIIQAANRVHLATWGVGPGKQFYMRQPDPDRLTWRARLSEGAKPRLDGTSSSDIFNGVIVQFTDAAGRTVSVGPPGMGCENEDGDLLDSSESNPVNAHGIPFRTKTITLDGTHTLEFATAIGVVFLREAGQRQRRGQITLTGQVEHPTAGLMPVSRMRAGDYVDIVDSRDNSLGGARRIIHTGYSHNGRAATLTLDNTAYTSEALLELLAANLAR